MLAVGPNQTYSSIDEHNIKKIYWAILFHYLNDYQQS